MRHLRHDSPTGNRDHGFRRQRQTLLFDRYRDPGHQCTKNLFPLREVCPGLNHRARGRSMGLVVVAPLR